jgi:hypothetical protein
LEVIAVVGVGVRTYGFAVVAALCLVAIAPAQESVCNLPLCVFSQSFVSSPQFAWEDICKQQLGRVPNTWNNAKVTDVGAETTLPQDAHRLRVKFRSGDWLVTAVAPKGHKFRVGEDVEVKQDGSLLSIRRRSDAFRIRITCVHRLDFVE